MQSCTFQINMHTQVGVCGGGDSALAPLILNEKCATYFSIAFNGFYRGCKNAQQNLTSKLKELN